MEIIYGYFVVMFGWWFLRGKKPLTLENFIWIGIIYAWAVSILK
jgi:hypothetical protein